MPCIKYFLLAVSLFFSIAGFSQSEELYKSTSIPIELKTKANAVVRYDKKTINITKDICGYAVVDWWDGLKPENICHGNVVLK